MFLQVEFKKLSLSSIKNLKITINFCAVTDVGKAVSLIVLMLNILYRKLGQLYRCCFYILRISPGLRVSGYCGAVLRTFGHCVACDDATFGAISIFTSCHWVNNDFCSEKSCYLNSDLRVQLDLFYYKLVKRSKLRNFV